MGKPDNSQFVQESRTQLEHLCSYSVENKVKYLAVDVFSQTENKHQQSQVVFRTVRIRLHDRRGLQGVADINKHESSDWLAQQCHQDASASDARWHVPTDHRQAV